MPIKLSKTPRECWYSLGLHSCKFPDRYTNFTYLNFSTKKWSFFAQFIWPVCLPTAAITAIFLFFWLLMDNAQIWLSLIIHTRDSKIRTRSNFDMFTSIQVNKNVYNQSLSKLYLSGTPSEDCQVGWDLGNRMVKGYQFYATWVCPMGSYAWGIQDGTSFLEQNTWIPQT